MKLFLPQVEEKILKFWEKNKIFERTLEKTKRGPQFVFYEGPPFANGLPGIHHLLSRAFKDIILRYKTMKGFYIERKAGWDTHGLPTEIEAEKKLGIKTKKEIEKIGVRKFIKTCKNSIFTYKKEWEKFTKRIGFWLDLKNAYITCNNDYIESLWWILKRVWEKGLLYQDYKVVPYCPRCQTSLSSHEVAQGYKRIKEPAIYVKFQITNSKFQTPKENKFPTGQANSKFKIQNSKTYLLVWTTTPWTLPGNVAIAVNPKFTYVKVKIADEYLILAKERIKACGIEGKIVQEFKGKDLLGKKYEPLYADIVCLQNMQNTLSVIAGDFVSLEEGTGLVHIAPAFGEEDMLAVKRQIPNFKFSPFSRSTGGAETQIPKPVDEEGKMNTPGYEWDKLFVKTADPLIIQDLKKRKILFKEDFYEHDYPFCWRCESPLLYYAKTSWFIKMTALRQNLIKNNQKINWLPAYLKEGRFGEWLREIKDWNLSRERFWGAPLPVWQCKECGYLEIIGSKQDLLKQKFSTNRYFLLRHGESVGNVKKIISDFPEKFYCPLTRKGEKQVKSAAGKLKKERIDLIFSSDLLRARQTAEIVAKELGVSVIYDKRLREMSHGIFNGRPKKEFENFCKNPNLTEFENQLNLFKIKIPQGENYTSVLKRVYSFLKEIDKRYQNKNILLIGHEISGKMIELICNGFSFEEFVRWEQKEKIMDKTADLQEVEFKNLPYNEKMELDFHRPYIDEVTFYCPKCKNLIKRAPEVIDGWFDSGAMPFAQAHFPFAWPQIQNSLFVRQLEKLKIQNFVKKGFQFPADFICEGIDQTRGWFYTLLAVSTLLGFGTPYKNVISLGLVLDANSQKMSKSKGNIVLPKDVISRFGADCARFYFYTINPAGEFKRFDFKEVEKLFRRFFDTLWNCKVFFETYANKNSKFKIQKSKLFKSQKSKFKAEIQKLSLIDKWIISRFNDLNKKVSENLNKYFVVEAARLFEDFVVEDLSNWYIRRSRKKLQKDPQVLYFILLNLSRLLAPFTPFISEAIYQSLRAKSKIILPLSVHLCDYPVFDKKLINKKLEEKMEETRRIVNLALGERKRADIKVRQPLASLKIRNQISKIKDEKELLELIKEEINVKEIIFDSAIKEEVELDTRITPELKEEGLVREIIRQIQEMRKRSGLTPRDKILIYYSGQAYFNEILEKNKKFLLAETRAKDIFFEKVLKEKLTLEEEIEIDGMKLWLGILK